MKRARDQAAAAIVFNTTSKEETVDYRVPTTIVLQSSHISMWTGSLLSAVFTTEGTESKRTGSTNKVCRYNLCSIV